MNTTRVRRYTKDFPLENAVERAITECTKEGILADFLMKNRAEAKKMSIYEYDEEKHIRMEREDALNEGLKMGEDYQYPPFDERMCSSNGGYFYGTLSVYSSLLTDA